MVVRAAIRKKAPADMTGGAKGVSVTRTRAALLVTAAFCAILPGKPLAQVFYQYPDAAIIRAGEFVVGPYLAVGDNELFRFGLFSRMNATRYFDVGFDILLDSMDGEERFGAAGDLRFDVFPETKAIPFDLSLVTGIGLISNNNVRVFQVPLGGVISSPFELDRGNVIVPYLGVYLLLVDTKIDRGPAPDLSDTDLDVEMRAGLRYSMSAGPDLFVGFHLGRDDLVTAGVSFWLKRNPAR